MQGPTAPHKRRGVPRALGWLLRQLGWAGGGGRRLWGQGPTSGMSARVSLPSKSQWKVKAEPARHRARPLRAVEREGHRPPAPSAGAPTAPGRLPERLSRAERSPGPWPPPLPPSSPVLAPQGLHSHQDLQMSKKEKRPEQAEPGRGARSLPGTHCAWRAEAAPVSKPLCGPGLGREPEDWTLSPHLHRGPGRPPSPVTRRGRPRPTGGPTEATPPSQAMLASRAQLSSLPPCPGPARAPLSGSGDAAEPASPPSAVTVVGPVRKPRLRLEAHACPRQAAQAARAGPGGAQGKQAPSSPRRRAGQRTGRGPEAWPRETRFRYTPNRTRAPAREEVLRGLVLPGLSAHH